MDDRLKCTVSFAEGDADAEGVRDGEVGEAVAIEIGSRNGDGNVVARECVRRVEAAGSIAQQDTHSVTRESRHRDVRNAVIIKVANRSRGRGEPKDADGVFRMPVERTVAVSEQHAKAVGVEIPVDNREVQGAVAVEIGDRNEHWIGAGGIGYLRLKRAIGTAEEDADVIHGVIGNDDVGDAIVIEVADRDGLRRAGHRIIGDCGKAGSRDRWAEGGATEVIVGIGLVAKGDRAGGRLRSRG